MDQIQNKIFKDEIKSKFSNYYTEQDTKCLWEDGPVESIDIKTLTIKPIHAKWIIQAFENISDFTVWSLPVICVLNGVI